MFEAKIVIQAETEEDLQAIISDTVADIKAMDNNPKVYVIYEDGGE